MTKHGIYLGDCMEGMKDMPDNYVDLAIVDPPYGIGETDHVEKHKQFTWNNEAPSHDYFCELERVSKNQIIWGCNNYQNEVFPFGRIVWNKLGPQVGRRKTSYTYADCEIASQTKNNNIKMFSYTWIGNVRGNDYRVEWDNVTKIHPQQKPVALYKWLLHNYAKEGDLILDTHMGSGSSYIACLDMGFDYIGYEIDVDYFKAIEERVYYFTRQTKLFDYGNNESSE